MLIIHGRKVPVSGLVSSSFLDDPKLGFTDAKDYGIRRTSWVRNICVHTRMGIWPQKLVPSSTDRHWDFIGVKNASADDRIASWHISIDSDGSFVCHLDLGKHRAYHAGQCNDTSIGIEMYQDADGTITEQTLASCVKVIDVITREFNIQRQVCKADSLLLRFADTGPATNTSRQLAYMKDGREGVDFVGVFGHRNATKNRGKGDPGDAIFDRLIAAGYERFDVDKEEDLSTWKARQAKLGMLPPQDGIAGTGTVRTLIAAGYKHGLWVSRPGD